jgi:hypothetical protein
MGESIEVPFFDSQCIYGSSGRSHRPAKPNSNLQCLPRVDCYPYCHIAVFGPLDNDSGRHNANSCVCWATCGHSRPIFLQMQVGKVNRSTFVQAHAGGHARLAVMCVTFTQEIVHVTEFDYLLQSTPANLEHTGISICIVKFCPCRLSPRSFSSGY